MNSKAAITITYCSQCNWMLRASWMAQELLHTFSTDIASVTLVPGTGGIFTIDVDGQQIWERKQDGGFPDAAELKRRIARKRKRGAIRIPVAPRGDYGAR
ncbi:SelT/SelW/SelH family protein [Klebsiella pneumoniae]|uniref:SelT/SelW/SelH family protein n=1 Tax=Klebsiella pneumoniae TaxID=573 RepID=UPI000E2BF073|nr:SelT/SelW/SelH family protein [Klebsiella pneumoniae]SWT49212.1 selT/selW/selH selenoprotein domain protein [Klebsiella pneumoniae]